MARPLRYPDVPRYGDCPDRAFRLDCPDRAFRLDGASGKAYTKSAEKAKSHQGQGPTVMALLRDAAISVRVAALPAAAAVALLVAALPTDA